MHRSVRTFPFVALLLLTTQCSTMTDPLAQTASAVVPLTPTTQPTADLEQAFPLKEVRAQVTPPEGWNPRPLKKSKKHTHQIWVSPSGQTAYGVMHFRLPLPVGPEMALWGFMREMEKKQGDAVLRAKRKDPRLPGIRFVAEGGKFEIRTNLIVRGSEGWAVYACTPRNGPVEQDELDLARRAREHTRIGLPAGGRSGT